MNKFHFLLSEYLSIQKHYISGRELNTRITSDPHTGVVAMTNTLDYFKVDYLAVNVPKTTLSQLPEYFICQLSNNKIHSLALIQQKEDSVLITIDDKKTFSLTKEEFLIEWTGFVLAIEKSDTSWFKNNSGRFGKLSLLVLALALLLVYMTIQAESFLYSVYLLLAISGFIISYLTFNQKINKDSTASKLCNITSATDCGTVLRSKEAKLFNLIDLSDMSIIFFGFSTVSFTYNPVHSVHFILSAISLPMVAYSLYSQYFRLKKWCPLCLGIAVILILQFFVIRQLHVMVQENYLTLIPFGSILAITILGWVKLKSLLESEQKINEFETENLTFRRNHDLFLSYYHALNKLDGLNAIPTIKVGIKKPIITLTIITNPFCPSCLKAHTTFKRLLQNLPDQLQLQFILLVPYRSSLKVQIAERLLQLYFNNDERTFLKAFDSVYNSKSAESWIDRWGTNTDESYSHLLKQQIAWCLKQHIENTPSILVNGKLFPKTYQATDIENFINPILDHEYDLLNKGKDIMHDKTETLNVYK